MKTGGGGLTLGVALFAAAAIIVSSVFVVAAMLTPPNDESSCGDEVVQAASVRLGAGGRGLSEQQRLNAAAVLAEGRRRQVPSRGLLIALAVVSQESGFRNYANDGAGGDLRPDQFGVEQSLSFPHEAVGTDHGSVGIFQQQWPWWGSMQELMTPATAAGKFYEALARVRGWQSLPLTVAAQRVQRSAYPSAYADDETLARSLLSGATNGDMQSAAYSAGAAEQCDEETAGGRVTFPLPRGSGYTDQRNWGNSAAVWRRSHTGTDLSVACGTPVLAATDGRVILTSNQVWAGRWLVQVSTGPGKLTTWYAHMRRLTVTPGQQVTAGQQIGEVGDLGNATGCHLHFEVHPRGGRIYEDGVNPTTWLASNVGRWLGGAGGMTFVLATFNTLGSSHTAAGGNKPWMASGPTRTRWAIELLRRHRVDVAGLQEFQRPQYRAFVRRAGDTYAVYAPRGDTENAIIWRRSGWRLLSATTVSVPYFDGHRRRMPVVRLASRTTGGAATFVNVHNPADTSRYHRQGRWRTAAINREVRLIRHLRTARQGPVFVTGDMNDKRSAFCALSTRVGMRASNGGKGGRACRPPRRAGIDWILATRGARFVSHRTSRDALVRRTTDHPLVVSRVQWKVEAATQH